jgi:hypothetical protein
MKTRVIRAGLVHEYTGSELDYLQALIECVEKLSPEYGASIRAQVSEIVRTHSHPLSPVNHFFGECNGKLDQLAPEGMYFGRPHSRSNMAGFWPLDWLENGPPGFPRLGGGRSRSTQAWSLCYRPHSQCHWLTIRHGRLFRLKPVWFGRGCGPHNVARFTYRFNRPGTD